MNAKNPRSSSTGGVGHVSSHQSSLNKSIKCMESACKTDPLYQVIQDELIELYLMVKGKRPD
jgi:hypothetical protein